MNRSTLFLITSDPRISLHAAEGIRIAAGILPWKKIKVRVYLHDPFVQALQDHPNEVLGLDQIQRYFPILQNESNTTFGPVRSESEFVLNGAAVPWQPLCLSDLALLRNRSTWLMQF